jgi:putative ABC transport system substrate-binding protein
MRRREFILGFAGAAAWPVVACAQQQDIPVIGFLHPGSPDGNEDVVAALRQGLSQVGYVEGRNLAIEYRWAEEHGERRPTLAADLVRRRVAVIVATGTATTLVAMTATAQIPIVFAIGSDPVRDRLVASLEHPGGNVTGMTAFSNLLITRRLDLLRKLVPNAAVFAFIVNPTTADAGPLSAALEAAARPLGLQLRVLKATSHEEFEEVFATIMRERIGALLVQNNAVFVGRREQLVALAARYAVPTIYEAREFMAAGGLVSYGSNRFDAMRQVGVYAGRILKGEKAAELPVAQPTKFELVINLKAAKAIGLTVPNNLLAAADEVIR